jgi:1-acyl-sn-glycerol-3-phosphate acyltransferase
MIGKIKMYWIFLKNFFIYAITAFLMKLFPKYHVKFRKWASRVSITTFISEVEIKGNIDESAELFVANHQNMVDIPIIEYLLSNVNLCWVAKKELGDLFLFGNLLTKSDVILIERENKKSLVELIKKADDRIKKGQQLIIFPEGTRNKNPKKLLPFKAGAKLLAEKYNFRVQPLLLLGIDEIVTFEPLKVKKGKLTVIALPARIAEKNSDWYKKLEEEMQKAVDEYYKGK